MICEVAELIRLLDDPMAWDYRGDYQLIHRASKIELYALIRKRGWFSHTFCTCVQLEHKDVMVSGEDGHSLAMKVIETASRIVPYQSDKKEWLQIRSLLFTETQA